MTRQLTRFTAISLLALAALVSGAAAQSPPLQSLPLLHKSDLTYLGGFRVPREDLGSSNFSSGGAVIGFNPQNNSLFILGHPVYQQVAEISIPEQIVISSNVNNLPTATLLQSFKPIASRLPFNPIEGFYIGGLMVKGSQLIGAAVEGYDADGNTVVSHFRLSSLNLTTASVGGLYQVGNFGGGYVGGYMAPVPSEWQASFGMPYLTGIGGLSILGRTSNGPAAFGFNPDNLGATAAPATAYVYYPLAHQLGGSLEANPLFNGTTQIRGIMFAPGTRSVLFFGSHGTGSSIGYGDASVFNDTNRLGKGYHSQNGEYEYQVWAYDALELVSVKNGQKQPWELRPYEVWHFDLPVEVGSRDPGSVAFNPATRRLYVSQPVADVVGYDWNPLIHVYQVGIPPSDTVPPDAPGNLRIIP